MGYSFKSYCPELSARVPHAPLLKTQSFEEEWIKTKYSGKIS